MRRMPTAVLIVLVVAIVLAARGLTGSDPERRHRATATPTPTAEWERIEPGGRTQTARGEPYAFWVRRGDAHRLMLFFQEGGGCFTYEMCAPGSRFFDDAVDASDDPSGEGGVLDRLDPRNPFRDHTTVFIPSATGDLHWGDARVRYRSGSQRVDVEHRGFVNAMTAVRWAFRHVPDPRSVLVTGCSAGSVGSAAFAPYVIRRYPRARVTQLGDSLAFVFDGPVDLSEIQAYANMPRWIPAVRALRPGRHTMADYYLAIARQYPDATFAQINYTSDAVQREFYAAAGGDPADFEADLRDALDEIHAGAPNFRSYLARGSTTASCRSRPSTRSATATCRCATGPRASPLASRFPTWTDRRSRSRPKLTRCSRCRPRARGSPAPRRSARSSARTRLPAVLRHDSVSVDPAWHTLPPGPAARTETWSAPS
jgi:hypothetical protein